MNPDIRVDIIAKDNCANQTGRTGFSPCSTEPRFIFENIVDPDQLASREAS